MTRQNRLHKELAEWEQIFKVIGRVHYGYRHDKRWRMRRKWREKHEAYN